MLTLKQMRKIEPKFAAKSDEELEAIRAQLYDAAQLAFDVWWARKSGSNNPVGVFPCKGTKAKL